MVDDFLTTKRSTDPRELLEKIKSRYPNADKQRQIFLAIVLEDRSYLRAVIEYAFADWIALSDPSARACRHRHSRKLLPAQREPLIRLISPCGRSLPLAMARSIRSTNRLSIARSRARDQVARSSPRCGGQSWK